MSTHLILGGTGKTGRRTAAHLAAAGHTPRTAARRGADVRFDWDDPATHAPALAGVEGAYIVPPALRLDHAPLVGAFAERAVAAGVRRIVLLSARGADADPGGALARAEAAVRAAAPGAVIVRPAWFAQNFTESFLRPSDDEGVIVAPAGSGAEPFVDAEDIAAVVAAALTDDRHAGAAYDLSGPEALTFAQAAQALSGPAGRPLRYVDPGADAWLAGAVEAGIPAEYAALLARLFGVVRAGLGAEPADGVQRALGREPGGFAAFAAREGRALALARAA
jgi:uncharacterized protein YbjT (DUF2867 family)